MEIFGQQKTSLILLFIDFGYKVSEQTKLNNDYSSI